MIAFFYFVDLLKSNLILKKILFFLFFLFLGCNKNKSNTENQTVKNVDFYLKNTLDSKNSEKQQSLYNDMAYELLPNLQNSTFKRESLDLIIDNYFYLNKWKEYNESSKMLLDISNAAKDSVYIAKAMRYQGNYYYKNKVLDSAFYYYLKSEKLFYNLKDNNNYAVVLLKKGIVQLEINDFNGADISLTKAYNILKKTDDNQRLYATLNSLGTVSSELKEYDKAIINYENALEVVVNGKLETVEHQSANCFNNIGLVYFELNDFKKAIFYYKKALLETNLKSDNPLLYSSVIDNLAYSKFKSNNYSGIESLFLESLKIRDSLDYSSYRVLSYIHLSEYFYKTNDLNNAKKFSINAIKIAKKSKLPYYSIASLKQAANADKENSAKYSEEYVKISDSLQIVERNSKDRFTRIQLETDELRQENSFLEEKNRNILNYFFASLLVFSLLLYMRTQRSKNRYLILEQAQQKANEDIYRLIISQQDKLEEGKNLEKSRIAKEIHDGILGRLFGLRLNLDGLNYKTEEEAKEERHMYLSELKLIEQDLREISHELSREKTVLINNFLAILNRLFEEQIKINKAELITLIDEKIDWNLLTNTTKINLYRIVQESLQNCNKYSKAKKITLGFQKDVKGNLILTIFDDGIGFEVNSKSKGIGLTNIIDRVHESLGTIDIISGKNKGTSITITVPLEHKTIKI